MSCNLVVASCNLVVVVSLSRNFVVFAINIQEISEIRDLYTEVSFRAGHFL